MIITKLKAFLGGADQQQGLEIVRGTRRYWRLNLNDGNNNPINLTGASISAVAEYYRWTGTVSGRNLNTTSLVKASNPSIANKTLTVTIDTDRSQGKATLLIPEDLATTEQVAPANATENVLMAVVWITINLGTGKNIEISRVLMVVRYGI